MEKIKNENVLGLKIGFWNINELSEDKSSNAIFKDIIRYYLLTLNLTNKTFCWKVRSCNGIFL